MKCVRTYLVYNTERTLDISDYMLKHSNYNGIMSSTHMASLRSSISTLNNIPGRGQVKVLEMRPHDG